ncbi:MAG: hypothetical protein AB7K09_02445 [Planctomycetota bacterium]
MNEHHHPPGSRWVTIGGHSEGDREHADGTPVLLDADGMIIGGGWPGVHGQHVTESSAGGREVASDLHELRQRLDDVDEPARVKRAHWISANGDALDAVDGGDRRLHDAMLDRSSYSPQRRRELVRELNAAKNGKQIARIIHNAARREGAEPGRYSREVLAAVDHEFIDAADDAFGSDASHQRAALEHAIGQLESLRAGGWRRQRRAVEQDNEAIPFAERANTATALAPDGGRYVDRPCAMLIAFDHAMAARRTPAQLARLFGWNATALQAVGLVTGVSVDRAIHFADERPDSISADIARCMAEAITRGASIHQTGVAVLARASAIASSRLADRAMTFANDPADHAAPGLPNGWSVVTAMREPWRYLRM